MPDWLKQAIVYQVYPQSFQDSNGDGIGDLPGLISRLDYLRDLGVTALWLNPVFESPFRDAGYDISDFRKVAPRYGTNADLRRLFRAAHQRGMKVLLDLVTAHTAIEHPWFQASQRHARNRYSDWYIWTDDWWIAKDDKLSFIWGFGERQGSFVNNFFWSQPALNYGFAEPDPAKPWQKPCDHPAVREVRAEMEAIMRFWLRQGCDGFRVDSAQSLVRKDKTREQTAAFWRGLVRRLRRDFPDMALVAEWGNPDQAIGVGFDADFMLHNTPAYQSMLMAGERATSPRGTFFDTEGAGDAGPFLDQFVPWWQATRDRGCIAVPTSNHDTRRLSTGRDTASSEQCFAFLLTLPAVPFLYYGEEIGLAHQDGLPSKEGGYIRTGARTPMQWDASRNAGFSTAAASKLYLPIDARRDRPTVAAQQADPQSLLSRVRRLIAFRHAHADVLGPDADFRILVGAPKCYPLVYVRSGGGQRLLCAFNPAARAVRCALPSDKSRRIDALHIHLGSGEIHLSDSKAGSTLRMGPRSWCVASV